MKYYKLDCAALPDELYNKTTDVKEWLSLATTSNGKFPPRSLNKVSPLDRDVEMERIFGLSLYMIGNLLPFALPLLSAAALFSDIGMILLKLLFIYVGSLFVVSRYYFFPKFIKKYDRPTVLSDSDIGNNCRV
mmetsp:Transcript_9465/g.20472  ORF Transcript_9465/g.20472 Transcript_9465/m.20472 type:complete len:133 (-) Transcript_9465:12-410(-)|eukprot:CAMPEP_0183741128 /NCGR_PEP_ID=MMETSP0737-20130205/61351_1 /TAXON_ID=385413 /ORGANISM="Thalassiosira miniscula, Strain CCMP1093" /LENGTH=132 /DNA_ID=CAMNT_0025976365 /DNA_START=53 /DNA_END=451 /DNA_ORIENTATION=+